MLVVLWVTQNNNNDHGSMSVSTAGCYCADRVKTNACLCDASLVGSQTVQLHLFVTIVLIMWGGWGGGYCTISILDSTFPEFRNE